jgi:hypothetical protein
MNGPAPCGTFFAQFVIKDNVSGTACKISYPLQSIKNNNNREYVKGKWQVAKKKKAVQ